MDLEQQVRIIGFTRAMEKEAGPFQAVRRGIVGALTGNKSTLLHNLANRTQAGLLTSTNKARNLAMHARRGAKRNLAMSQAQLKNLTPGTPAYQAAEAAVAKNKGLLERAQLRERKAHADYRKAYQSGWAGYNPRSNVPQFVGVGGKPISHQRHMENLARYQGGTIKPPWEGGGATTFWDRVKSLVAATPKSTTAPTRVVAQNPWRPSPEALAKWERQ